MSRNISDYASTKPREAFAEAFSYVATNGNNANHVSILIIDHWNKLFTIGGMPNVRRQLCKRNNS